MKITASFIGRQSGSTGIFYKIKDTYEVESVSEFRSLLHEDYWVLRDLKIKGCSMEEYLKSEYVKVRSNHNRKRKSDGATYLKPNQTI